MSRAQRLLDLLQELRLHRYPVTGADLARTLGVSLRTLYRDIATLQAQGARIEGEPGLGYVLRPGFTLPPLTFTEEELEAIVLGARWVVDRADAPLGEAARHAIAKIRAVLPADRRALLEENTLLLGPRAAIEGGEATHRHLTTLRRAIRGERTAHIAYGDGEGRATERTIWPFAIGFFENTRVVVAWCELRAGYRNFRLDRIARLDVHDRRYPRRRHEMLAEWRRLEGIPDDAADGI